MLFVYLSVCLSVCQHGLVMQSVSAPPCAMGRQARRHNQQNTGSHAAPSRDCRVLSIAVNPKRSRATEPALLLAV